MCQKPDNVWGSVSKPGNVWESVQKEWENVLKPKMYAKTWESIRKCANVLKKVWVR